MADREKYKKFQGIELYGANDLESLENFKYRKAYSVLFPTETSNGYELPTTIDYWNDPRDTYYGRLDRLGNVIIPNVTRMKSIRSIREEDNSRAPRTEPMYVFDFVADAFKQFQKFMNFGYPAQKIKGSPWEGINPQKAWFNIDENYQYYLRTNVLDVYSDQHLYKYKHGFKVLNARDYVNQFFDNYVYTAVVSVPITQTAHTLSTLFTPLETALCINLAKLDESEDFDKFETWVKDPSFDYFRYEAARHGFMVDKNAPWRIVANVTSHQMRMMMKKNNVLDDYYFNVYYQKTLFLDIDLLKMSLFNAYNKYAEKHPIETKPKALSCKMEIISSSGPYGKKVDFIERSKISFEDFNELFENIYWYEKYFHLRLRETGLYTQGNRFNDQLFERHIKKIFLIDKHVDSNKVLEYINNYIQKRWQPFTVLPRRTASAKAQAGTLKPKGFSGTTTVYKGMSGY